MSIVAGLLASGCGDWSVQHSNFSYQNIPDQTPPDQNASDHIPVGPVLYQNAQYNFKFYLPANWQGYSVLAQQWTGQAYLPDLNKAVETEHGPTIVLRNPQWTAGNPWQDIPILVFTRKQWKANRKGRFSTDADGFESEIAHNSKYVFAIWNLFNWDESVKGAREAEGIVARNAAANAPHLYPGSR